MGIQVFLSPLLSRDSPPPLVPNLLLHWLSTAMANTYSLASPSLRVKVCLGSRLTRSTSCTHTEVPTHRLLAARSTASERTNTSSPTPNDSSTLYCVWTTAVLPAANGNAARLPCSAEPQPPLSITLSTATVQRKPRTVFIAGFLNTR